MSQVHKIAVDLLEYAQAHPDRKEKYKAAIMVMRDAAKFKFNFIPERDLCKFSLDCIAAGVNILPYDNMMLEFQLETLSTTLLLVRDPRVEYPDLRLVINIYWQNMDHKIWIWAGTMLLIKNEKNPVGALVQIDTGIIDGATGARLSAEDEDNCYQQMNADVMLALACLGALSSKSTRIEDVPVSEKLNKRRAQRGKPPLSAYKSVSLPKNYRPSYGGGGQQDGRSSPATHWRRGHIRHWHDGRLIPIPPVIVNAADGAPVHREYRVGKSQSA